MKLIPGTIFLDRTTRCIGLNTEQMTSKRHEFNATFDDFFTAFGRSVHAKVELHDGTIVLSHTRDLLNETLVASSTTPNSRPTTRSFPTTKAPSKLPRLSQPIPNGEPSPDTSLPRHLMALVGLQASDGSWRFDDKFQFVINGVAPPPPEGINPKLWATAIVVTIFRQSPEYFEQLESAYEKAMLHVDDDVLRLVKPQVEMTTMKRIRPYENNEAKAIRERLAQEAAAKRAQDDAEEARLEHERKQTICISKYSRFRARHLPMDVQELMRMAHTTDLQAIFPEKDRPPPKQLRPREMEIDVGDVVECCWRRIDGSKLPQRDHQWRLCLVTALNSDGKTLNVHYLDDPFERERNVLFKYVRLAKDDAQSRRSLALDRLREQWVIPIGLDEELERLQEIEARRKWRSAWNTRSLPVLSTTMDPSLVVTKPVYSPRKRLSVNLESLHTPVVDPVDEELYQSAVTATLAYTKLYKRLPQVVKDAGKRYATAILFQERFHSFDAFVETARALVQHAVSALEAIEAWMKHGFSPQPRLFIWNGQDFVVQFLTSLDYLSSHPQAREWYGDDFPFSLNPFLMNESIRDFVQDNALQFTSKFIPITPENPLRLALRMHKEERGSEMEMPSWWPMTHYDEELRRRIKAREVFVLSYLQTTGYVI